MEGTSDNTPSMAHSFPISSPIAAKLRSLLLSQRKKVSNSLEPELSIRA